MAQLIVFDQAVYNYEFADSTYNTEVVIDKGILINGNIGQLTVIIPINPIERSTGEPITKYLENSSRAFLFQGLIDGTYELSENGEYEVTGRGIMRVDKSDVGRGFGLETSMAIEDGVIELEMLVPLLLEDYGFNMSEINRSMLTQEFSVRIKAKANF